MVKEKGDNLGTLIRSKWLLAGAISVVIAIAVIFSTGGFSRNYVLDDSVLHLSQMVPEEALWYLESPDPGGTLQRFRNSRVGKNLEASGSLDRLLILPGLSDIRLPVYLSGLLGLDVHGIDGFLKLIGGTAGMAGFPDGSKLLVMKVNPAVGLAAKLSSRPVPEPAKASPPKKEPPGESGNMDSEYEDSSSPVGEADFVPLLTENALEEGGIEIRQFQIQERRYYITLLSDYLFLSDRIETLRRSLSLAGEDHSGSLYRMDGFSPAADGLNGSREQMLVYYRSGNDPVGFLMRAILSGGESIAMVLRWDRSSLEATLFETGPVAKKTGSRPPVAERLSGIPADVPFSFASSDWTLDRFIEQGRKGEGGKASSEQLAAFLKKAGLNPGEVYGDRAGLSFVFNGFTKRNKKFYPDAGLRAPFGIQADRLVRAVFETEKGEESRKGGLVKTVYPISGGGFLPARGEQKGEAILAVNPELVENLYGAGEGLIPSASDRFAGVFPGDYAKAPVYFSFYIPALRNSLRDLLYEDAKSSPSYSKKTVDRDILPVLDAFAPLIRIQGVLGLEKSPSGEVHFQFDS